MKKNWIITLGRFFKRKKYIDDSEAAEVGYTKPSLIEIAKKVVEEENKTKNLNAKLEDKFKSLRSQNYFKNLYQTIL